jgi:4,5-dihydroxyphthalate decarboxylase
MPWTDTEPSLHYELSGHGERSLVLIHESGGSMASWSALVRLLADEFRMLRYDQCGAGVSERSAEPYSATDQIDDLEAVLVASGLPAPFDIAGAAAGAAIAVGFALRAPEAVRRLALCVPSVEVNAQMRRDLAHRAEVASRHGMRALADQALAALYPQPIRGPAFAEYRARFLGCDPVGFAHQQRAFAEVDLDLERVSQPCLLLAGEHDVARPPATLEPLVARIPNATAAVIEGAGHVLAVQAPDRLAAALRGFLGDGRRAAARRTAGPESTSAHGAPARAVASPRGDRPWVHVTLAINDYEHTRDLCSGEVAVEGVDLTVLRYPVEEIFFRFSKFREWDVSELSLAKYCTLRAGGDDSLTAIPVFPSRSFRHSAIFVREDGPVDKPEALRGGRIGVPEWTQTATVYARALLEQDYGVGLEDVTWVQAGTNEPGRVEGVELALPAGIRIERRPHDTLNDLLLAGELDAVIAAHPPAAFEGGRGRVRRLFSAARAVEQASFERTGVFPIMHVVALRADLHERHPWIAMNLMTAFEAAKRRSLERAADVNTSRFPVPWQAAHTAWAHGIFGDAVWPYGIEANRRTLEAFSRMCERQGLCERALPLERLFASQVQTSFRV